MKKMLKAFMTIGAVLLTTSGNAFAGGACLYGSATGSSGQPINGTMKVSTSYGNNVTYPRGGRYRLCMGSNPKMRIDVYVDGRSYTSIYVNGDTRLNISR